MTDLRTICELDGRGFYTGASREIGPFGGRPPAWVEAPVPPPDAYDPAAKGWAWLGSAWALLDLPSDAPTAEALIAAINAERDRRIRTPFTYLGHPFDYDDDSQKRITGAAALAGFALTLGGKKPGDQRWHDGAQNFVWIAHDNVLVPMDAPACFGLGRTAAAWESAHVFAAKALKTRVAADEVIADVTDPQLWPA